MIKNIGAHLYIFIKKYDVERDIDCILDGLAEAGYTMIEDGGPPQQSDVTSYRAKFAERNVTLCGSHLLTPQLHDLEPVINDMHALGVQDLNVSGLLHWHERSAQDYREAATLLNSAGKKLRTEGIYLHYHNHDFEFQAVEGERRGIDLLLEQLDLTVIDLCVDIGWVWFAGLDPIAFLRQHADNIGYLHLRDFLGTQSTALGQGEVPLPAIMEQVQAMPHIRHVVIEQDPLVDDPFADMATSLRYLSTLKKDSRHIPTAFRRGLGG